MMIDEISKTKAKNKKQKAKGIVSSVLTSVSIGSSDQKEQNFL